MNVGRAPTFRSPAGTIALTSAIAGLASLLVLSEPWLPDPNSWLVWANQIAHGHGIDFSVGPSWKPLPVIWSIPGSWASSQAAALAWMWLVRSCAAATLLLAAVLVTPRFGRAAGLLSAVFPLAIGPWNEAWLGGSAEPVLTAAVLAAALAWRAERREAAIMLVAIGGLVRPEAWLLAIALLALEARHERRRAIILAAAVVGFEALAWFIAPWALGGSLLQASDRAQTISIAAEHGLIDAGLSQLPAVAALLVPAGAWAVVRRRDPVLIAIAIGSVAYALTVALAGIAGYSGIPRYYVPAAVGLAVLAGPGAAELIRLIPSPVLRPAAALLVAAAIAPGLAESARQAHDTVTLADTAIDNADRGVELFDSIGGPSAFEGCEPFGANGFEVRILARKLELALPDVSASVTAPTVVLDDSNLPKATLRVAGKGARPKVLATDPPNWTVILHAPGGRCPAGR